MEAEILDIRESSAEELERAGIITDNNYVKLFLLDVKHSDGIRENIYFGWASIGSLVSHTPYLEGWTLEHYDMILMARIERFAWKYRNQLLEGADIKDVIKEDSDNILKIDMNQIGYIKTFVKEKRN